MLSTRPKAIEGDHERADWHAGYTNAFAALERDNATIAASSQLDALIPRNVTSTSSPPRARRRLHQVWASRPSCWQSARSQLAISCSGRWATRSAVDTTQSKSLLADPPFPDWSAALAASARYKISNLSPLRRRQAHKSLLRT